MNDPNERSSLIQDKDVTNSEVPPIKSKLQDVPLQIYMKEKHQPEVVVKDPKRKAKVFLNTLKLNQM